MRRHQVYETLFKTKLLPLFYHIESEVALEVANCCRQSGVPVFEFTNRGAGALQTFEKLVSANNSCRDKICLGAGSIVEAHTAAQFINLGADFIVGPNFNPEIALVCNRRKVAYIPGCGSVSEISQAESLGCEFVKIFPAREMGGPAYIKALSGPMPWVSVVATGGVELNEADFKSWFSAGTAVLGLGSCLFDPKIIKEKKFSAITEALKLALTWTK